MNGNIYFVLKINRFDFFFGLFVLLGRETGTRANSGHRLKLTSNSK